MADLLVEWYPDHPIRSLASPTVGRIDGDPQGHRTGDHRRDGFLIHRGPRVPGPAADAVDARHLAHAICTALDVRLETAGRVDSG
jgi:hypothetical protein